MRLKQKVIGVSIAVGLMASLPASLSHKDREAVPAVVRLPETTPPVIIRLGSTALKVPLETAPDLPAQPPVSESTQVKPLTPAETVREILVPTLGNVGLKEVIPEQGVNRPGQLVVTANKATPNLPLGTNCGSQFDVSEPVPQTPHIKNIVVTVFGKLSALIDEESINQLVPNLDLGHKEGGELLHGYTFDETVPASIIEAVTYMAQINSAMCTPDQPWLKQDNSGNEK
jgi:hypothetical protein